MQYYARLCMLHRHWARLMQWLRSDCAVRTHVLCYDCAGITHRLCIEYAKNTQWFRNDYQRFTQWLPWFTPFYAILCMLLMITWIYACYTMITQWLRIDKKWITHGLRNDYVNITIFYALLRSLAHVAHCYYAGLHMSTQVTQVIPSIMQESDHYTVIT